MTSKSLRVADYLRHILEAIGRIRKYTEGLTEEDFYSSPLIQDAVIRNIGVMGEGARNIELCGAEVTALQDQVPFRSIYRMRNKLAHGYFSVDLSIVWNTAQEDIPALRQQIQQMYDKLSK